MQFAKYQAHTAVQSHLKFGGETPTIKPTKQSKTTFHVHLKIMKR